MAAAARAEDERAMLDKPVAAAASSAPATPPAGRTAPVQLRRAGARLVVRQLEAVWEAALAEAGRLEADYQRFAGTAQDPQRSGTRGDPGPGC